MVSGFTKSEEDVEYEKINWPYPNNLDDETMRTG